MCSRGLRKTRILCGQAARQVFTQRHIQPERARFNKPQYKICKHGLRQRSRLKMCSHTHRQVAHRIRNAERFGAYLLPSGKESHRQAWNLVFFHGSTRRLRGRYQARSFNLHSVPSLSPRPAQYGACMRACMAAVFGGKHAVDIHL